MTAVTDFLLNRSSEPRLESPAPDSTTLERAFSCAARAPDHALLRPWRYLVIEGKGLEALGELFASTCANNSDEKEIEKLRRAPPSRTHGHSWYRVAEDASQSTGNRAGHVGSCRHEFC